LELKYVIETPLRDPIEVGLGASLILEGWAFCAESPIRRLFVLFDGKKYPVTERGNARQDVLVAYHTDDAPRDIRALRSGFWVVLPLSPAAEDRQVVVRLVAEVGSGETVVSASTTVTLKGTPGSLGADARLRRLHSPLPEHPRVCICMTTYNPGEAVFRRQIESIRAQTYDNWVCIIQDDWSSRAGVEVIRRVLGDDPRFVFERNDKNLGFYLNFEKVLRRVPADCDLVCLSDQDDEWFPHKLETLIKGFRTPDTTLVYSDMHIVDGEGKVLSKTFWSTRRNNYTDIETLFFANTITGAATMFKASLLPLLLPFPPKRGLIYHDWWLGLVALAAGRMGYIDEPLYAYYQHGGNVVGWSHIGKIVSIKQFLTSDPYRRELAHVARTMYNYDCKFLAATIQTLRLRIPDSPHESALRRLSRLPQRPLSTLLDQVARATVLQRASQNREKNVFMAHAVMRMLNTYFTRKHRELAQKFTSPEEAASSEPGASARHVMPVDTFERKCAPLTLDVRPDEPPRVNMFLAMIDFKYFFGGYIGMFQLAKHIARAGFRVRFIIHEQCDFQPAVWRQKIQKYKGLEDIFDLVEVEYRFDRAIPLTVSPEDRWVATSCWSAWLADSSARALGNKPFVFMIQEYEPYFVPHGSYYALSHAAYDLNLYGLFSTEILREFFRQKRFGVFRNSLEEGDAKSTSFHNATLKFRVNADRLRQRTGTKKKFLFYCRPEAHAQRNMFELGILALRKAISDGALDPTQWDFYGIGTVGEQFVIPLPKGAEMTALPKMSLEEYAEYLPDFDLGMSLMYTPHPSLVPLEMASAGLVTVTNSCENKTADVLRLISTNFEVGEANIDDLAAALKRAEGRIGDIDARVRGAAINWPTSWEEAFAPDVMRPLIAELARGIQPRQVQPV
jgi:glycosyltransferase involved in cell wall biosynthesis